MKKKTNENVVVLEEYTTNVEVPAVGTAEHREAAIDRCSYRKYVYRRTNTYIYVGVTWIYPTIVGKKLFNRTISNGITLKNNKIYGSFEPVCFKYIPKFEWVREVPIHFNCLLRNNNILKQILMGKITSRKSLLKAAGKIHFKGDYTSKNVEYLLTKCSLSVYDLNDFCREGARGYLDRLAHIQKTIYPISLQEYEYIIRDLILDHKQLGDDYYFSCKWSIDRLRREHQQSILKLRYADFAKCSTSIEVNIDYKVGLPGYVDLIDNERMACEQAAIFNNCSYRLYWPKVKEGTYLLLIDNQVNAMIGLTLYKGKLEIDQYFKYNNEWCPKPEWLKGYLDVHNNGAVNDCKRDEITELAF
jgi:hypothetical protein